MIQRYDMECSYCSPSEDSEGGPMMEESKQGDYVKFKDHEKAVLAERKATKDKIVEIISKSISIGLKEGIITKHQCNMLISKIEEEVK